MAILTEQAQERQSQLQGELAWELEGEWRLLLEADQEPCRVEKKLQNSEAE